MKKRFIVLLLLIVIVSLSLTLWWNQAIKPINSTDTKTITFTVGGGETVRSIADRLFRTGLIHSPVAFFLIARFGGIADNIQAGDFRLSPSMDLYAIANQLTHGTIDTWIQITEGWRNEEIAHILSQELDVPENEFLKIAKEGYMFPDTYRLPKDASAAAVVNIFLNNFNQKVTTAVKEKAEVKNLTLSDLVIIASLVEREAKFPEDRPLVASVIINRLKIGMKLDIDATVQYALGYQSNDKTWWKKELTVDDLTLDSTFNTYKNSGLPPAPIANPGISAIKAVIDAPDTQFFYYIADKTGKSHFAKTLEEHNDNISKYLSN